MLLLVQQICHFGWIKVLQIAPSELNKDEWIRMNWYN